MELANAWNEANGSHLKTGWVVRTLKGHLARDELPEGLRPRWERRHGSPWAVDRHRLELPAAGVDAEEGPEEGPEEGQGNGSPPGAGEGDRLPGGSS